MLHQLFVLLAALQLSFACYKFSGETTQYYTSPHSNKIILDHDHKVWIEIEEKKEKAKQTRDQAWTEADRERAKHELMDKTGYSNYVEVVTPPKTFVPRFGPNIGQDTDESQEDDNEKHKVIVVFDKPENKVGYLNAMTFCMKKDGNLLHVTSDSEITAIKNLLKKANYADDSRFWISGTDAWSEGEFVSTANAKPLQYFKWLSGRPNGDQGSMDNCIELVLNGDTLFMNDKVCSDKNYFICQI